MELLGLPWWVWALTFVAFMYLKNRKDYPIKLSRNTATTSVPFPATNPQTTLPFDPNQPPQTLPLSVPAEEGKVYETTAFPQMIPVPTNMTVPQDTSGSSSATATNVPSDLVNYGDPKKADAYSSNQPVNAVMSQWSQWGPCEGGITTRTRTCVHDGINGGLPCGATKENMGC